MLDRSGKAAVLVADVVRETVPHKVVGFRACPARPLGGVELRFPRSLRGRGGSRKVPVGASVGHGAYTGGVGDL